MGQKTEQTHQRLQLQLHVLDSFQSVQTVTSSRNQTHEHRRVKMLRHAAVSRGAAPLKSCFIATMCPREAKSTKKNERREGEEEESWGRNESSCMFERNGSLGDWVMLRTTYEIHTEEELKTPHSWQCLGPFITDETQHLSRSKHCRALDTTHGAQPLLVTLFNLHDFKNRRPFCRGE